MVAIFVVLTIVFFIILDVVIQKLSPGRNPLDLPATAVSGKPDAMREHFILPKGVFFYPGHTWASLQPSGKMNIGIDDFAQKLIGRIDAIESKRVGDKVKQGEPVITVKQGNRVLQFASPVDGILLSNNMDVLRNPSTLKANPYIDNWILQVQPTFLSMDLPRLFVAERSVAWFRTELSRFKDFLQMQSPATALVGVTSQDGGVPVDGVLEQFNDQTWSSFQKSFLAK